MTWRGTWVVSRGTQERASPKASLMRTLFLAGRTSPRLWGILIVATGVLMLSLDSLLIRLLAQTMPFIDVIFWRGVGAAAGFSLLTWRMSRETVGRTFKSIGRAGFAIAMLSFVGNALFVTAITHTTVAHTLVITATTPVITAVLSHFLIGERASPRVWLLSTVVAVGVFGVFLAIPSRGDLVGDSAALSTAFAFSLIFVMARQASDVNMMPAFAIGGALTVVGTAPLVTRFSLSPSEAVIAFVVGVVVVPLSFRLLMAGLRYLPAPEVSLLTLLETALGPLWVLLALRETPDLRTVLSGAVILIALASNAVAEWRDLHWHPLPRGHDTKQ